ncbi:hypothetical protein [Legionella jordanis]|uniref:Dehydrogenase n=1 Tax=Legionella jordanis TaxID=456 RepID=A0A0W0VG40_9GAMM|nr:hypothetical protein [Legionella jordanis]KTD19108.1 dehydrogenase [Legionella jordanis]RMW99295.1 hypothetical protein EAW55_13900 [Legionella jordanis]VEH12925.1 dehydrogenase [Legionella jordanis]
MRKEQINLLREFIERIHDYASGYLKKDKYKAEDNWSQVYEDITPYLAKLLVHSCNIMLADLDNNSPQRALQEVGQLLQLSYQALEHGPEIIETNPGFLHNFYYSTSPLAQYYATDMKSSILELLAEYKDVKNYFSKLSTFKTEPAYWDKLLLDIEFNQYRQESLMISPWLGGKIDLSEMDIAELFSAIAQNKFIKKIVVNMTNRDATAQILKALVQCRNLKEVELTSLSETSKSLNFAQSIQCLANSHLTHVHIDDNELDDQFVRLLAANPNLVAVKLAGSKLSELALIALCGNPSIKEIALEASLITDAGVMQAAEFIKKSNVSKLELQSHAITEGGLRTLAEIDQIVELSIASDQITDKAINLFSQSAGMAGLKLFGRQLKYPGVQLFSILDNHPNRAHVKQYLLAIGDKEFLQYARRPAFVQFVITDPDLANKLDYLAVDNTTQTYSQSCAAHSMMLLLNKFGLVADHEVSRRKELEIYSEIWLESGANADLSLILNYMARNNLKFDVIEDVERTSALMGNLQIKEAYSNAFASKIKQAEVKQVITAELLQKMSNSNHYFFLITIPGNNNKVEDIGHIVLLAYENNQYCLFDPGKGRNIIKKSVDEILKEMDALSYAGIAIQVHSPAATLLKSPGRDGFFTAPQSERFKENNEVKCVVQ